jgi:hypothetical protein
MPKNLSADSEQDCKHNEKATATTKEKPARKVLKVYFMFQKLVILFLAETSKIKPFTYFL